jgi:hypothetical protein
VKLGLVGTAFKFACKFGVSGATERHELNEDKWLYGRVLPDLLVLPHVSRFCKQSVATVEEKTMTENLRMVAVLSILLLSLVKRRGRRPRLISRFLTVIGSTRPNSSRTRFPSQILLIIGSLA